MRPFALLLLAAACPAQAAGPLWGFADLHAHPAAHLGFGSDAQGENGIVWGKPGLALEDAAANLAADMRPCDADAHEGFDLDPIRKGTHRQLLRSLDNSTAWDHSAAGAPGFSSWPDARSIDHQQMHILGIRRAYEGGLRLMIATAVDNELLSVLWTRIGFNLFGNRMPPPSPTFDYDSARRQLDFIQLMARRNSSWMRVVSTAAEARQAIRENKLALVLGIEMDALTAGQILDLVKNHQVRHVIPIHLVDNSLGGTALAENLFNSSNQYVTGSFYQVVCDPTLQFRLGRPAILKPSGTLLMPGAMLVTPLPDERYAKLGYNNCAGGHRNAKGLAEGEYARLFAELMRAGVLVDIAHMSAQATESAIRLAEAHHYPLMDSHTGLRHPCTIGAQQAECGSTERDLMRSHARRLAALGGMIGFGTGAGGGRLLYSASHKPRLVQFTRSNPRWVTPVSFTGARADQPLARLWIVISNGNDALHGAANVIVRLKDSRQFRFPNINQGSNWPGDSTRSADLPVPAAVHLEDIAGLAIEAHTAWTVTGVTLMANETELDPVGQWLLDYQDVLEVMGGRHVALGTDMNGFSPQIPSSSQAVTYPLKVGSSPLPPFRFGSRVYDFQKDGLAQYGLLPDFIQAVSDRAALHPKPALDALYRSAEDVVEMWEKAEAVAAR